MGLRTLSVKREYFQFQLPSEIVYVRPYVVAPNRNQLAANIEFKEWARMNVRDHWTLFERQIGSSLSGRSQRITLWVRFRSSDDAIAYKLRWM